jgi:hypothetical protein
MKLEVLNPRAVLPSESISGLFAPRPETLDGKRVAVMVERFPAFFDEIERLLKEKYPTATFTRLPSPSSPVIFVDPNEIKANYDVFFEGVKTTGSSRHDICATLEKLGMPGVHFTVGEQLQKRRRVATANGVPTIRVVCVDTMAVFSSEGKPEKYAAIARKAFPDLLKALFDPLTEEEKNPEPEVYDYGNLVFEGETYAEANEKFLAYFNENKLGDGLGLVPPTPEAVKWMLTGTSRDPQEVVGIMVPRNGKCTVEKIAINAVMAGAKPEYLPVIIAAVEALSDPAFNLYHIQNGALCSRPVIWVNGPIVKEIGMNCRSGYLGPGNRANASIGRAIGLCMINLGWRLLPETGDMLGQPERYVNILFAENEEDSPWESFAVQQGFAPEDSTVTVDECQFTERSTLNGGGMFFRPLEVDLKALGAMVRGYLPGLSPMHHNEGMTFNWVPEALVNSQYCTIVLHPALAQEIAAAGYTKEKLAQFLADQRRTPFDPFSDEQKRIITESAKRGSIPGLRVEDCVPGGTIPTVNPKHIVILVAGGECGQVIGIYGGGGAAPSNDNRDGEHIREFEMKKITGATLTRAGR